MMEFTLVCTPKLSQALVVGGRDEVIRRLPVDEVHVRLGIHHAINLVRSVHLQHVDGISSAWEQTLFSVRNQFFSK